MCQIVSFPFYVREKTKEYIEITRLRFICCPDFMKMNQLKGGYGTARGGGGTLGISGWGCAAGTLEPLAYTRASFSWILLPYTRVDAPNHSYPRVAVFQKLRSLAQSKAKPKQNLIPQLLLS